MRRVLNRLERGPMLPTLKDRLRGRLLGSQFKEFRA